MVKRAYIKHIASYFPAAYEENDPEARITKKIGINKRPIVSDDECSSDLSIEASKILFEKYNIDKNDIDAVILCTETPDYFMPATACVIHGRLGLKEKCMAFDFNHGCTGYIYGLSLAKALIENGQVENVLLLTADTLSKIIHPKDMRTKPVFGDGAAATLISAKESDKEMLYSFQFGTKGIDFKKIIVNYGGMRMKSVDISKAFEETADQHGNIKTDATLYMDGKSVVQFTQSVVPPMVESIISSASLTKDDITNFIFHQANRFMLQTIQTACGIADDDSRYFNDCSEIGNTISSSIPHAVNTMQQQNLPLGDKALLMGFGVGLSWGGCIADLSHII